MIKLGEVIDITRISYDLTCLRRTCTSVAVDDFIWDNVREPIEEMVNEFVGEDICHSLEIERINCHNEKLEQLIQAAKLLNEQRN